MAKLAIIGDTTCDLTPELRKQYDIDYCRMKVSWVDKNKKDVEIYGSLDWEEISHKDYFDLLAGGTRIFTSQVNEQEFDEVFTRHLEAGEDIIYIGCSSALSASVLLAQRMIDEKFSKKYPDRKIIAIDSLICSIGQGSLLILASNMRKEGKTIEEIANYINEHKLECNQVCTVENLDTLKRAGRVKASTAFFGNLFGVKPILISDAKGNNYAYEKQKGRRNALIRSAELVKEWVIDPEEQTLWISDAECKKEDMDLLVNNIKALVPFKNVVIVPMGPVIGASAGKGTIGIYFMGKKVEFIGA